MGSLLSSLEDGQIGRRRGRRSGRQQAVQFLPSDEGDGVICRCRRYMCGGGWGFKDRFHTPACGGAIAWRQGIPHRTARPILTAELPACPSRLRPGPLRPRIRRPRLPYGLVRAVVRLHYSPCRGAPCLSELAPPSTGSSHPGTWRRCLRRLPSKTGRSPTKNGLFQVDLACRLPRRPEWHVAEVGAEWHVAAAGVPRIICIPIDSRAGRNTSGTHVRRGQRQMQAAPRDGRRSPNFVRLLH
jgi:hypothetical protein